MRIVGCGMVSAALLVALLGAGVAHADNNPNGMVFRAVGWFSGKGQVTATSISCEVPTTTNAIGDGVFEFGLWNTYGVPTLFFPDRNNPFGNPCGVWLQLQNNLLDQAIQIDHIALRYKILGARRFRQFVPSRNAFPIACRYLRKDTLFVGAVVNPVDQLPARAVRAALDRSLHLALARHPRHRLRAERRGRRLRVQLDQLRPEPAPHLRQRPHRRRRELRSQRADDVRRILRDPAGADERRLLHQQGPPLPA